MRKSLVFCFVVLCLPTYYALAKDCEPEKVNRDCELKINRSFPVAMPTIQMHPHSKVDVKVLNPLPFEALTLDFQGAQALAGTDQTQSLASSVLPMLKGVTLFQKLQGANKNEFIVAMDGGNPPPPDPATIKIRSELEALRRVIDDASQPLKSFGDNASVVYAQLQEVLSPIPRSTQASGDIMRAEGVGATPNPWGKCDKDHHDECYKGWKQWILQELVGSPCLENRCSPITNLIGEGLSLQAKLSNTAKAGTPPEYPIFSATARVNNFETHDPGIY